MTEITLTASNATLLIPTGATQSTSFQDTCKVNHLWRLALSTLHLHQTLSCDYVREMISVAKRSSLDINFVQSCYCNHCYLIFVPGITCQVSHHKRGASSRAYRRASRIAKKKHMATCDIAPLSEMSYQCLRCDSKKRKKRFFRRLLCLI